PLAARDSARHRYGPVRHRDELRDRCEDRGRAHGGDRCAGRVLRRADERAAPAPRPSPRRGRPFDRGAELQRELLHPGDDRALLAALEPGLFDLLRDHHLRALRLRHHGDGAGLVPLQPQDPPRRRRAAPRLRPRGGSAPEIATSKTGTDHVCFSWHATTPAAWPLRGFSSEDTGPARREKKRGLSLIPLFFLIYSELIVLRAKTRSAQAFALSGRLRSR